MMSEAHEMRPLVPVEPLPARVLQWSMDSGYLTMTYPAQISPEEIEEVERVLQVALRVMKRSAQGMEARRVETLAAPSSDDSQVAESDAPHAEQPSPDSHSSTMRGD